MFYSRLGQVISLSDLRPLLSSPENKGNSTIYTWVYHVRLILQEQKVPYAILLAYRKGWKMVKK